MTDVRLMYTLSLSYRRLSPGVWGLDVLTTSLATRCDTAHTLSYFRGVHIITIAPLILSLDHVINLWPHLLVVQSGLHRRPVLHLLGQPAIAGTGQMLLLHGGSNAYCSGLLVLQHVSEALEVGGKKEGGSKKKGTGDIQRRRKQGSTSSHFSCYGCRHTDSGGFFFAM